MPLTYEDADEDYKEKSSIRVVSSKELADVIADHDVVMNY
jgi:hypothetical protein